MILNPCGQRTLAPAGHSFPVPGFFADCRALLSPMTDNDRSVDSCNALESSQLVTRSPGARFCAQTNGRVIRGQNAISHPGRGATPQAAAVVDKHAAGPPTEAPIRRIFYLSSEGTHQARSRVLLLLGVFSHSYLICLLWTQLNNRGLGKCSPGGSSGMANISAFSHAGVVASVLHPACEPATPPEGNLATLRAQPARLRTLESQVRSTFLTQIVMLFARPIPALRPSW